MSNFYEDASVVMVPSGYKTSKVYSSVPDDGSADLTLSRSNDTATRVGPDGLIEKVRTNVSLYSEDYTNSYWLKGDINLSANSIANPVNGEITATTITPNTNSASHYMRSSPFAMSANTEISQSIYAKANGYNYVMLEGYDGSNNPKIMFNLSDSSFSTISATGNPVGSVEALEDGWYRLKMTWTTQAGSPNVYQYYFVFETSSPASWAGNGTSGAYFFGAQLEYGVTTDYIATTSSAVSVGPLANIPRLDYSGGANSPSLLLEPQRTNYQVYSENSALWTQPADGLSVTYNTTETLDPSGYYGAEKVTSTGGNKRMFQSLANPAGAFAVSAFVKAGTGSTFGFVTSSGSLNVQFDVATGAITNVTGTGSIVDYGNGWYRCIAVGTASGSEVIQYRFFSNNGDFIYFYGAQLEIGAYASSYIPTLSATVTRVGEAAYKTGISSLIGQTEGTLFIDIEPQDISGSGRYFGIESASGSGSGWIAIISEGSTPNVFRFYGNTFDISGGPALRGVRVKAALAYKNGVQTSAYVNGVSVGTLTEDTTGKSFSVTKLGYGPFGNDGCCDFHQALIFPTALTDAQLAELTTL